MLIFTIVLVIAANVCAVGWFLSWLRAMILICFLDMKHYPLPTADEMKVCSRKALEVAFKRRRKD